MRTVHHRIFGVAPEHAEALGEAVERLAGSRSWRVQPLWVATAESRSLFEMEYFRHAQVEDGASLVGAGFVQIQRDETDALAVISIMAELSAAFDCRTVYRDEGHPLAKLRYLEFRGGRLPSGQTLDDLVGTRPVVKRVGSVAITFYPPRYRGTTFARNLSDRGWAFSVHGMRAHAPTFLEAEREAMKMVTGLSHLDP